MTTFLRPNNATFHRRYFAALSIYARWLYGIKLGRVRSVTRNGQTTYIKTRHRRRAVLVALGNTAVRIGGGDLLALNEAAWLDWEQQIAPLAWQTPSNQTVCRVEICGRALHLKQIEGASLAAILTQSNCLETRMRAVELSVGELRRMQRVVVRFPDGIERAWSHGDAHAKNVIVDLNCNRATWFDFETIHAVHCPRVRRHADDLRALAYSAAAFCPHDDYAHLAATIASRIEDSKIARELNRQSQQLQQCPRAFHLAQAHLDWPRHQHFGRELQRALKTIRAMS